MSLVVLKFGSSVLRAPEHLGDAVHEIYRHVRGGRRVVAVVSALGATTDRLLEGVDVDRTDPRDVAELLATGEAESVELVTSALTTAGIPARGLERTELGLFTTGERLDAHPEHVDADRLRGWFERYAVLVVPGFVGVHHRGGTSLLGRGGSDLTALFLADALDAPCTLLKDVPGVFAWDPARPGAAPPRYRTITFADAQRLDGELLQRKALGFAAVRQRPFRVGACGRQAMTLVGAEASRVDAEDGLRQTRLRVGVLGCGVVGGGVVAELLRLADRFELVGVAVRHLGRSRDVANLPRERLTDRPAQLLEAGLEVLVHATPPSRDCDELVVGALSRGIDVVTADKQLVSSRGRELIERARFGGGRLRRAATVGGAVPMLEATRRAARRGAIRSLEGVLNGTSNFVLERLSAGADLGGALAAARAAGLAERDATADLSGLDAARKLAILACEAWGCPLDVDAIDREPIPDSVARDLGTGVVLRQIARVSRDGQGRLHARVAVERVGVDHPFADLSGAENALRIEFGAGSVRVVRGLGAGRGPTTEAVLADLFALCRRPTAEALGGVL